MPSIERKQLANEDADVEDMSDKINDAFEMDDKYEKTQF